MWIDKTDESCNKYGRRQLNYFTNAIVDYDWYNSYGLIANASGEKIRQKNDNPFKLSFYGFRTNNWFARHEIHLSNKQSEAKVYGIKLFGFFFYFGREYPKSQ